MTRRWPTVPLKVRPPTRQRRTSSVRRLTSGGRTALIVLAIAGAVDALVGDRPDGSLPNEPHQGPSEAGGDLRGAVVHGRDGDTIEVAGTPVRIANLDCAERGDEDGPRATARMTDLVARQEVVCDLEGRMSYDREVGTCALAASGEDLGEILIREGVCERWR